MGEFDNHWLELLSHYDKAKIDELGLGYKVHAELNGYLYYMSNYTFVFISVEVATHLLHFRSEIPTPSLNPPM